MCSDNFNYYSEVKLQELTPTHQVFQVFARMFQTVISTLSNSSDVRVLATKSSDGSVALVLANFASVENCVGVTIDNIPAGIYDISEYLIDSTPILLGDGVAFSGQTDPGWDLTDRTRFTPLSSIDTSAGTVGAFSAASLRASKGQTLGEFRWLVWSVAPVTGRDENTAFQELSVDTAE